MTRQRLPDRRPSMTTVLVHNDRSYSVTIGFDVANDRVGEVFTHGAKVGSGMDAMLDALLTLVIGPLPLPQHSSHSCRQREDESER